MEQQHIAKSLDDEPAVQWALAIAFGACGLGFGALTLFLALCAAAWLGLIDLPLG